jgi:hypothetical protein
MVTVAWHGLVHEVNATEDIRALVLFFMTVCMAIHWGLVAPFDHLDDHRSLVTHRITLREGRVGGVTRIW